MCGPGSEELSRDELTHADMESKSQELQGGGPLVVHGVALAPFPSPGNREGYNGSSVPVHRLASARPRERWCFKLHPEAGRS